MVDPDAYAELAEALERLGYPDQFAKVIAHELGGEKSIRRMASYLRQARPSSPDEIADEMLAILSERRSWVERKISERAQAEVSRFYNRRRDEDV